MKTLTAYIEYDEQTKLYVGLIPGIVGAHTQGETLDELNKNLKEVLELCIEENPDLLKDTPKFIGVQQIEVA
ncbi:MAG TPA: type II toxin-antitoxin system HicB family antitoxin [Cyanobacteria bacterium UBA9971]|nr:type II toxin-antitoxin system HicB family antitoxin [Cyanobacteria bacterium UBA9971]